MQGLKQMSKYIPFPRLQWEQTAAACLPIDMSEAEGARTVPGAWFSRVPSTPISDPELVCVSWAALKLLHIERESCDLEELTQIMAGNKYSHGYAHCYAGHQFGYFSGQLGDGAAMLLGGAHGYEVQLKGAGLTPYSRQGDGRKILRSSLREFLACEHMHALGIPTTRAGGIVTSKIDTVVRDEFYDGNAKYEHVTVVMRIAKTFLRFGSFEIFKKIDPHTGREGPSANISDQLKLFRTMLDYTRENFFAGCSDVELFSQVVTSTAKLVAQWQGIGFCHGVLNTDNMSILGDTIDYGPYGFMEHFDPDFVCNTSDNSGRYTYREQPNICKWNCRVLADQLSMIVDKEKLQLELQKFDKIYEAEYREIMKRKFGLLRQSYEADDALFSSFFEALQTTKADFTCSFRALSSLNPFDEKSHHILLHKLTKYCETIQQSQRKLKPSFSALQLDQLHALLAQDPGKAQVYGITNEVLKKLKFEIEQYEKISKIPPEELKDIHTKTWREWISLFTTRLRKEFNDTYDESYAEERKLIMNGSNPFFVLRNHFAQDAIESALLGNYAHVEHVLKLLMNPFEEGAPCDLKYSEPMDPNEREIKVSCSS